MIQNLVFEPRGVALIHSLAGTRRSGHYHKTDWHYLYVIEGCMLYAERPIGSTERPEPKLVKAGSMVYTGPMVEHFTEFPVETKLISISMLGRAPEMHEADLVRVTW
jgi:quercetin dioxygenase-like cupin family protein